MSRGSAAQVTPCKSPYLPSFPPLSSLPSLPALPALPALPSLRALSMLPSFPSSLPLRRKRPSTPLRSPLVHDHDGVAVGAAVRRGLLHHLRGAPTQDRNAVIAPVQHPAAMLSVYAGHGKHGAHLAELAATVVSKHVRRSLFPRRGRRTRRRTGVEDDSVSDDDSVVEEEGEKEEEKEAKGRGGLESGGKMMKKRYGGAGSETSSGCESMGSFSSTASKGEDGVERVVDDAFVEANIAVDGTGWARNCGVMATVCVVRKGRLVVGCCGGACVMIGRRRGGKMELELVWEGHAVSVEEERERMERCGGVVREGCVSDTEERVRREWTRGLGDVHLREMGVCQVPEIRNVALGGRDAYVVVSSQKLWAGAARMAPERLALVLEGGGGVVDMAEGLMKVAFGACGPTMDATILCAKLR